MRTLQNSQSRFFIDFHEVLGREVAVPPCQYRLGNATAEALILLSASTKPLKDWTTLDKAKNRQAFGFPAVIKALPEADMPFPGVKAWILQGEKHQLIFFEMQPTAVVPEHSHRYPQWGMVVEGTMELTINGKTRTINKGDDYLIPADATHHARFLTKTRVIDLFSERTRYKSKPAKRAREALKDEVTQKISR